MVRVVRGLVERPALNGVRVQLEFPGEVEPGRTDTWFACTEDTGECVQLPAECLHPPLNDKPFGGPTA